MKKYVVFVNGNKYEVEVEEVKGDFSNIVTTKNVSASDNKAEEKKQETKKESIKSTAEGEKINAPMPGKILKVNVKAGDSVKKGDVMFILEAMKMENEIMAPRDGKVVEVNVSEGAAVNTGDVLSVIQ